MIGNGEQHGYAIVEGEVTNISQSSIQNVQAVVRFYTSSDQFITSDTSLLNLILFYRDKRLLSRYMPNGIRKCEQREFRLANYLVKQFPI